MCKLRALIHAGFKPNNLVHFFIDVHGFGSGLLSCTSYLRCLTISCGTAQEVKHYSV